MRIQKIAKRVDRKASTLFLKHASPVPLYQTLGASDRSREIGKFCQTKLLIWYTWCSYLPDILGVGSYLPGTLGVVTYQVYLA